MKEYSARFTVSFPVEVDLFARSEAEARAIIAQMLFLVTPDNARTLPIAHIDALAYTRPDTRNIKLTESEVTPEDTEKPYFARTAYDKALKNKF